jgi:DNA (cytosine-5)-methyltransferase 1
MGERPDTTEEEEAARPIKLVRRATGRTAVAHHRGNRLRLAPHPDAPDPSDLDDIRRWVSAAPSPTAIDLFAGAGGLSRGLADAGFTVLLGADADAAAAETHHHNIGGLRYDEDLRDPTDLLERLIAWGITDVDLVAGGVPCQPFSRAGQSRIRQLVEHGVRQELDVRADLWLSFVRVIDQIRPRAVLLENVPDLAAWDDGAVILALCESLRDLGYRVDARVLDAYNHGVPQHRRRLFLVGLLEDVPFHWPEPDPNQNTLRDAIGDLPIVRGGHRAEVMAYTGPPATPLQRWLRRHMTDRREGIVYDHMTRAVRPDDAEAFALLAEGQTYEDLPQRLRRYRSDIFTDKYKRLVWNDLSRTITAHIAKDGYWYIHPSQDRTLSVREAARIQTFPDDYRFAGQPSLRYRQIGNAVPPLLGQAIGRALRDALASSGERASDTAADFRHDLVQWSESQPALNPWRDGGTDPWIVLFAELCLRRATPRRARAVLDALASPRLQPAAITDDPDQARRALDALGLGTRADLIIELAQTLVERHGGQVPDEELQLGELPGVGNSLVQALRSFAFDQTVVVLDRSAVRVMTRLNGHTDERRWQMRLDLYRLSAAGGPDRQFNSAISTLAATICEPDRPHCGACPVRAHCHTGREADDLTLLDAATAV